MRTIAIYVPVAESLFVTRLCPAKTAEQINVLFGEDWRSGEVLLTVALGLTLFFL